MNNEPVAWMSIQEGIFSPSFKYLFSETKKEGFIPLYTAPRELQKLTDDEKNKVWLDIWNHYHNPSVLDIFAEIEIAILKKANEK